MLAKIIIAGNWLENCFIDELLKANDNILLEAEGTIVETPKPKCFKPKCFFSLFFLYQQHFLQQTNSSKKQNKKTLMFK